jgi:hypothetical protein
MDLRSPFDKTADPGDDQPGAIARVEMDPIIARLDRARALLAEASDAGGAKRVADLASAAEVYARRQKLSQEAIGYATAIRVEAMAMMGEFLKESPKNTGAAGVGPIAVTVGNRNQTPTLAESGITKRESSAAQSLATLKESSPDLFEKVRANKVSITRAVSEFKREGKREQRREAASVEAVPPCDPEPPHPFAALAARVTQLAADVTRAMRDGGESASKLKAYLGAAGALKWKRHDSDAEAVDDPDGKPGWLPIFVQLAGIADLIELAADPGRFESPSAVRNRFLLKSGGKLSAYAHRRRLEKKNGGAK